MPKTFHAVWCHMDKIVPLPFGRAGIQPIIGGLCLNRSAWRNHRSEEADPYWRVYLPLTGEIRLHFGKEIYPVLPGNLYLIPPQQNFRLNGVKPCSHYWFHFNCPSLQLLPSLQRPVFIPDPEHEYRKLLHRLLKLALHAETFQELAEFHHIPVVLVSALLDRKGLSERQVFRTAMEFAELKQYIEENLSHDLQSAELARLAGMKLPDFTALFREETGLPPKQYLSMRRINRAKQLLLTTDEPVKNIAKLTGFPSLHLFYRLFSKYALATPCRFRKIYRRKENAGGIGVSSQSVWDT